MVCTCPHTKLSEARSEDYYEFCPYSLPMIVGFITLLGLTSVRENISHILAKRKKRARGGVDLSNVESCWQIWEEVKMSINHDVFYEWPQNKFIHKLWVNWKTFPVCQVTTCYVHKHIFIWFNLYLIYFC